MSRARWSIVVAFVALAGCGADPLAPPPPEGSLVLTQVPVAAVPGDASALSVRYPPGSRIVLAAPPLDTGDVTVLSGDLVAAGAPSLAADGRRLAFCGQAVPGGPWQVYEVELPGGAARQRSRIAGGAADPAWLPDGSLVVTTPVPPTDRLWEGEGAPFLAVLDRESGAPRRVSFGAGGVADPTVLDDGRILFVGVQPGYPGEAGSRRALFAINPDGTGLLPCGANHEGVRSLRRPRQTTDGRVIFLGAEEMGSRVAGRAEQIRLDRPWRSRGDIVGIDGGPHRSLEPAVGGTILATRMISEGGSATWGVVAFAAGAAPGEVIFDDPEWHEVEALPVAARPRIPMIPSALRSESATGLLLCLDVSDTTLESAVPAGDRPPRRVRVLAAKGGTDSAVLGEAPVYDDGSFLVEVPANRTLGFEVLTEGGEVIHRLEPSIWVRPGEVRGCVGCHAPHGFAPRNRRPIAVQHPPAQLAAPTPITADGGPR